MPRPERPRFSVFDSVRIAGRVLVSAPARGSARVTGGVSRPVSEAADLYQRQAHVSLSHPYIYRIFTVYLPYIWRNRLFGSENFAFYCYSEEPLRDAV